MFLRLEAPEFERCRAALCGMHEQSVTGRSFEAASAAKTVLTAANLYQVKEEGTGFPFRCAFKDVSSIM